MRKDLVRIDDRVEVDLVHVRHASGPTIRSTPPVSGAINCASPPDSTSVQPGGCHMRNQCEGSMYVRQCGGCVKLMVLDARSDWRHVGPSSRLF